MRVVVFGASGIQGAAQVKHLAYTEHEPVAVSRSPKPLEINGRKIETAAVDFNDTAAVKKVVQGADRVLVNLPSTSFNPDGPVLAAAKAIGEACKAAKVPLIVFNTSMPVPETPQDIKAQDDRREMRRMLRDTGVPVISIQPVSYLDNLLEGWALPPIRDRNTVVYCHKPELEVSWICHEDNAKLMIAAMERPELAGRNFAVGGPETVRLHELAAKLGNAWGREMKHEYQTIPDFCDKISQTMAGRGLDTDRIVRQMFKAYTYYNETPEFKIDMGPVLKELPVTLTPIEQWAKTHRPEGWE